MNRNIWLGIVFVVVLSFLLESCIPANSPAATPVPTIQPTGTVPSGSYSFIPWNRQIIEMGNGVFVVPPLSVDEWVIFAGDGGSITPGNVELGKGQACAIFAITGPTDIEYTFTTTKSEDFPYTYPGQSSDFIGTDVGLQDSISYHEEELSLDGNCIDGVQKIVVQLSE